MKEFLDRLDRLAAIFERVYTIFIMSLFIYVMLYVEYTGDLPPLIRPLFGARTSPNPVGE